MKFILHYLKPFKWWMLLGFTIKVLGSLVELALPYILSYILNDVVPLASIRPILKWGGIMLLCALIAWIFNIKANQMASRVARDAAEAIRHDLFAKTMRLSARQVDEVTIPSLESRLTTDTYNVHHFIGMIQRLGVRAPILMVGGLLITWSLDRYLTLIMMAVLPLICVVVWLISSKGIPLYTKVQQSNDRMVRLVREDAQGIRVIKALSRTEDEKERFNVVNHGLVEREEKAGLTMAASNPIINLLLNIGLVGVVVIGASLVNKGQSLPGSIIGFIQYFTLIANAMLAVTRLFMQYAKGVASANRIKEIVDKDKDLETMPAASCEAPDAAARNSAISFRDVTFSYNGIRENLNHISFDIPAGSSLGIIGATGSGKTTLIQLLMRFYDPSQGSVFINGKNLKCYQPEELHRFFGCVMQNDFIYADTIRENIDFGRNLSDEDINRATEIAQVRDYIESRPDGYQRMLSAKGSNISGGQRQRILIARAVAGQPAILILDDASSALDYKTDANLRSSLSANCQGVTTVIVAQRVSSVRNCGLILVLDDGNIIGRGTHEQLLQSCPAYREISDSQMGGAFLE